MNEQLKDISVKIKNRYDDISPLLSGANWVENDAMIFSCGTPNFYFVNDETGAGTSNATISAGNKIKSITVGCKVPVSNSILKNNKDIETVLVNSLANGTARAIENTLFYGDQSDTEVKTITSTGTVITVANADTSLANLQEMYKAFNPSLLDGNAIWKVSKEVRDMLVGMKFNETAITFDDESQRLNLFGVPVYVDENFNKEKGIIAALVNPRSIYMRCTIFDNEQGLQQLKETKSNRYVTEFLSIFNIGGVVDKADSAIILKVEAPAPTMMKAPTPTKTRKAK